MEKYSGMLLRFFLSFCTLVQQATAQPDSLHRAMRDAPNDTVRMEVYYELASYYTEIRVDSAQYFCERELGLARKLKLKLWEAESLDLMGYILLQSYNYPAALDYFSQAQEIADDPESEKNIWKPLHFTMGKDPETVRLFVKAGILHNLGHLYGSTDNIPQQVINYREVVKIAREVGDQSLASVACMNLGTIYMDKEKLDSALIFEQKAFEYAESSGYKIYQGFVLNQIGNIYFKKGSYDSAMKYTGWAIEVCREQNNQRNLGAAYISMSKLLKVTGHTDSAFYFAGKGLNNFQLMKSATGLLAAYNTIFGLYKSQNNTDSAFVYLQLAKNLNDSLGNAKQEQLMRYLNIAFDKQLKLQELEKEKIRERNIIRTYAMLAALLVVLLITLLLYRNNRQKQKSNNVLAQTLTNLKATQSQLIQSEKMASLGELTAGIAHEIQNPLNFVNNFSEVNTELIEEMKNELKAGNTEDAIAIANDIADNGQKINHHGKRADAIVKGMLQHSRSSSATKEPTDINKLADEYLRLAYHGLRAKDKSFNATIKTQYDESIGKINVISQDIGRVVLNLITNAFYVVSEKKKQQPEGYEPTVSVITKKTGSRVEIKVKDNGNGIPQKILDKIFQPFFTTKPTGQGTGLGLSLSYDIIKAHGGELNVETKEGEFAEFIITLPQ